MKAILEIKVLPLTLIIILVIYLYSSTINCQTLLKGTISDSESKLAITDANIYIENSNIGTVSNEDGKFYLSIPKKEEKGKLIISSLGYKKLIINIDEFEFEAIFYLIQETTVLDEVLVSSKKLNGKDIIEKVIESYDDNYSINPFFSKAFIRHSERNKKEYRWLVESAATIYFPGINNDISNIKINIDENRKSIDNRSIDSLLLYRMYLTNKIGLKKNKLKKELKKPMNKSSISEAINWNDLEYNNVEYLIKNPFNILRNIRGQSIFGDDIFKTHKFTLDTIYWEDENKLFKIKIAPNKNFIDLNYSSVSNKGFVPIGWIYVYDKTFAVKELNYALVAGSKSQIARSNTIFHTKIIHTVNLKYRKFNDKMYPLYFSYTTPKAINYFFKPNGDMRKKDDYIYYTKQEVLFNENHLDDKERINLLVNNEWNSNIFSTKAINKEFWKNYTILLESEEEKKMINDLEKKVSLKEQFERQ